MNQLKKQSRFRRGFKKWADETAIRLRTELGLYAVSPICAFTLCKHLKVSVFTPRDINGMTEDHLNELLGKGSDVWSAATVPLDDNRSLILHNPNHSEARQQSNLMHEIAHILCEHKIPKETIATGLSGFLRNHNDQQEDEAEWLGACLQLPRPALLWALKRNMSNTEIANHFNASEEMVRYRINITGVKTQISRRKY